MSNLLCFNAESSISMWTLFTSTPTETKWWKKNTEPSSFRLMKQTFVLCSQKIFIMKKMVKGRKKKWFIQSEPLKASGGNEDVNETKFSSFHNTAIFGSWIKQQASSNAIENNESKSINKLIEFAKTIFLVNFLKLNEAHCETLKFIISLWAHFAMAKYDETELVFLYSALRVEPHTPII